MQFRRLLQRHLARKQRGSTISIGDSRRNAMMTLDILQSPRRRAGREKGTRCHQLARTQRLPLHGPGCHARWHQASLLRLMWRCPLRSAHGRCRVRNQAYWVACSAGRLDQTCRTPPALRFRAELSWPRSCLFDTRTFQFCTRVARAKEVYLAARPDARHCCRPSRQTASCSGQYRWYAEQAGERDGGKEREALCVDLGGYGSIGNLPLAPARRNASASLGSSICAGQPISVIGRCSTLATAMPYCTSHEGAFL